MNDDFRYMKFIYLYCGEEMKLRDPQLPVGLLAQLVERCIGIAEVMGSWLVCSAHFKPEGMYRTITERTRLKPGVVPSQFAWTKEDKKRRQKNCKHKRSDVNSLSVNSN